MITRRSALLSVLLCPMAIATIEPRRAVTPPSVRPGDVLIVSVPRTFTDAEYKALSRSLLNLGCYFVMYRDDSDKVSFEIARDGRIESITASEAHKDAIRRALGVPKGDR